jgi:predicted NBD/HSP70 family sugar kinase
MSNPSTSDPTRARDINLLAVLDVLRAEGSTTRAGIARSTGLSAPTISEVVSDLVAAGVVRQAGQGPATGGRRGGLVELIPASYVVAALDLSARHPLLAQVDLCGQLVESSIVRVPRRALKTPAALVRWLGELDTDGRVLGIGVAVPGVTDPAAGRIEWSPRYGWRDVDLRDLLVAAGTTGTVLVENDLNLAAVGEHAASGDDSLNMAMLGLRGGLGAGLIVGGKLYHGSHHAAGEVGYLATSARPVGSSREFGPLEKAVFDELRRAGLADEGTLQLLDQEALPTPLPSRSADVLEDLIFSAALALATVLDPEHIVLGQELTALVPHLPGGLQARLDSLLPHTPSVVASQLGELASLRGAGIATLRELTPSFRRLLS